MSLSVLHSDAEADYLSPEDVAEMVPGLTVRTLKEMRADGRGPAYSKPSPRTVVYARADVVAYLARVRKATRDQS